MESTIGDAKPLINEGRNPSYNDYVSVYNTIIKKWMDTMQQKWSSQGFSCKSVGGDDKCDNNNYGFRSVDNQGNNYYFPYEMGVNIQLFKNPQGEDGFFQVWDGKSRKTIGVFGKGAKNTREVEKAANDAINSFNQWASRAFSYAYPK